MYYKKLLGFGVQDLHITKEGAAMKKVLLVERDPAIQNLWERQLAGKVAVIKAFDTTEAKEQLSKNPDIEAIVITVSLSGSKDFVYNARQTFRGPMVATSSLEHLRKSFLELHGCDVQCEKIDVTEVIIAALSL
ncbi:MAG: hypothetical protein A2908_03040 [Candidatus Staskawiczbacteria bacterium RIFCSPLOWO2_01_FULL_38_12b]|uniref:Response regulatory domain-containing protein n=1 Tax=Candidatus Staskawiczbacteria bacterium RIFCSPLOWO2_01_FULL_38_12b TaxID=1802214 RepID=A0A1G2ICD7_9BACT|nr:MAG: hypothetical protein A2908_03040 [Candidatus Staskawiczbacteria bacterium RIFCSPLOWO2_01_FULL_38_12b]QBM02567.1 hypothetical protein [uncultured archaeon]